MPRFVLRRMACFGSPKFDRRRALHILSADSRFPDIQPGNQMKEGNHFFSVFPQEERVHSSRRKDEEKRKRLRGGEYTDDEETYRTKKRKCADRTSAPAAPVAAGSSILGLIFGGKDGGDHHEAAIRKPLSFWNSPEDEWLDHARHGGSEAGRCRRRDGYKAVLSLLLRTFLISRCIRLELPLAK
jgi:hypothetical protein